MNMLDNNEDCDVALYFKNLGYGYSWDKDREYTWHEIYKDKKLILQVEMVPLKQIIKDMCVIEDIEIDYFGATETPKDYKELCDKVREFELNKNKHAR